MEKKPFIKDVHYYLEDGRVVFTALYHLQREICCGNKCRHCPYFPEHIKGITTIKPKTEHGEE